MDYVKPHDMVKGLLVTSEMKLNLPVDQLLLRGALAGAFLAVATSMAVVAAIETGLWIVGSLLFPFGLCIAVLLGMEIITGSFALLPCAAVSGKDNATPSRILSNWAWVFVGNLFGSTLYAVLLAIVLTTGGTGDVSAVGTKLIKIAEAKTTYYAAHGAAGLLTVFTKAMLCNWMVSLAVVFAYASTSLTGKMIAIWGPTVLFFSQGFEHAVVNMFAIPMGMLLGANVSLSTWWMWNQIPVTLGNLVGGMVFTGLAMYYAYGIPQTASPGGVGVAAPSHVSEEGARYSPSL